MDRRQNDRRAIDRRKQNQPASNKAFYLLVGLAFFFAAYFTFFGFGQFSPSEVANSVSDEAVRNRNSARNYEDIRADVLQRDEQLLAAYRQKKEEQREASRFQNNGKEFYERRMARIEKDLKSELLQKTPVKEGSLSWGLHQDLEQMKSDPPPQ